MANELKIPQKLVLTSTTDGFTVPRSASDPVTGIVAGDIYYNTVTNKIKYYNGSSWGDLGALAGISLPNENIIVGNASGVSVTLDTSSVGDILIDSTTGATIKALSITNSMINATAAIAYSKLAALTTGKALQSNSSTGFIEPSAVTNTELGYVSGVTSAIQTQFTGKASTTLNNLGVTAINAHLIPATDGTYDLGTGAKIWQQAWINYIRVVGGAGGVDVAGYQLVDSANDPSVLYDARTLNTGIAGGNAPVFDWSGVANDNKTRKLINVVDPAAAQDAATKNYVDNKAALYLPLAGGTMTGIIAMGSNRITGLANATGATDAVNKSQLDAISSGLVWKDPIYEPNLFDDSLSAPPGSPAVDKTYLVSSSATGLWTGLEGHIVSSPDGGTTWVDHSFNGAPVSIGDRFGICLESGYTPTCTNFTGKKFYIATVTNATPGSYAYTFDAPADREAVFCNNPQSYHFSHSYTYNATLADWLEFSGPAALGAGIGLAYSGNTLNVNLGAGIKQLPSDEVGIDFKSDGAVWLVDPTTGLTSTATDAQLSIKLDSTGYATLSKSVDGVRLAALGVTNAEVATAAAIALSKLASMTVGRAVQSNASTGYLEPSSVTNTELGYVSGVTSAIQTQLDSKLNLSGGTMTGVLDMGTHKITNVVDPTNPQEAATKAYVDMITGGAALVAGNGIDITTGTISVKLDGGTLSESASGLKVATGGISDTQIASAAAISFSKLASLSTSKAVQTNSVTGFLEASTVSNTELGYLSGVTSGVQSQLNGKEASISAGTTSQYWRGDKTFQTLDATAVGLGNVDNVQQIPMSYLDIDGTMAANSDTKVASQKATRTYIASNTANQQLSNLGTTAINSDLIFNKASAKVKTKDQTAASTPSTTLTVQSGDASGATSASGDVTIKSGSSTNANTGNVLISTSNPTGAGNAGAVTLTGGTPSGNGNGGPITITAGSGGSSTGSAGTIDLISGDGPNSGTAGNGGDITIAGGFGTPRSGNINLQGNQVIISTTLGMSMSTTKITNVTDPTSAQDVATKAYVDSLIDGLEWKYMVRAATVTAITLSGTQVVDGVTLVLDDRVLVKDQGSPATNGIYLVKTGSWVRTADANTWAELQNAAVMVGEGTINQNARFQCNVAAGGTLNVTPVTWIVFAGGGNVSGIGTAGYNAYWTGAGTLGSEQYVSPTRGGIGTDGSAFTGLIKASAGSFSASALVNADVASGAAIDYSKLAALTTGKALQSNASTGFVEVSAVTNTELGYVSGVTSAIQTQFTGKANTALSNLSSVAINTSLISDTDNTDDLGSGAINWKDLYAKSVKSSTNVLVQANAGAGSVDVYSGKVRRTTDNTNFIEEAYVDSETLTANTTTTPTSLTYATASFSGCEITYSMKQATSNDVRTGTIRIANNASLTSAADMFAETNDCGIMVSAAIVGSNVEITFTNSHVTRNVVARFDVKRIRA